MERKIIRKARNFERAELNIATYLLPSSPFHLSSRVSNALTNFFAFFMLGR